jgi:Flp pilus assembly pilin Flp
MTAYTAELKAQFPEPALQPGKPVAPRCGAREKVMKKIIAFLSDEAGQDMVEYALLAGFVAVAAGALLPPVANDISAIFSKLASVIADAP